MSKIKQSILAFAIGDAVGVPVEFKSRNSLKLNPVKTMMGFGVHNVPKGTWSDDTSMMLATIDSIVENKGINYKDIADKFLKWYRNSSYTATDIVFDIGNTTVRSLEKYEETGDFRTCGENDENSNGNGSLMRILPIAFYCFYKNVDDNQMYEIVKNISSITHSHEISILGCYLYSKYISFLLKWKDRFKSFKMLRKCNLKMFSKASKDKYRRIFDKKFSKLDENEIQSSGYVVSSLEAVLWCVLNSDNFENGVLKAVNLGNDTDTISALTAGILGLIYDEKQIPEEWKNSLIRKIFIENLSDEFEKTLIR